jgi:hypothetical protein
MVAAKNGHAEAYARWFQRYEIERKKRHISAGRNVPGVPPRPPGPDEVRRVIFDSLNPIGERLAAELCNVHRTTIGRWLDGSVQIPPCAYQMLLFHAEGIPPGCGERWRGFQFQGDGVVLPDGKTRLTALEIAGWRYQRLQIDALQQQVERLEKLLVETARRIDPSGCANDAFTSPHDPRTKAFT